MRTKEELQDIDFSDPNLQKELTTGKFTVLVRFIKFDHKTANKFLEF
jgi:hypothetical protein